MTEVSRRRLSTCAPKLQEIITIASQFINVEVLCGHRSVQDQEKLVAEGRSRTLSSKHVLRPSQAVDIAPFPFDWGNTKLYFHLAGIIMGIGLVKGIQLRWGGSWDGLLKFNGSRQLEDLGHFELILPIESSLRSSK